MNPLNSLETMQGITDALKKKYIIKNESPQSSINYSKRNLQPELNKLDSIAKKIIDINYKPEELEKVEVALEKLLFIVRNKYIVR